MGNFSTPVYTSDPSLRCSKVHRISLYRTSVSLTTQVRLWNWSQLRCPYRQHFSPSIFTRARFNSIRRPSHWYIFQKGQLYKLSRINSLKIIQLAVDLFSLSRINSPSQKFQIQLSNQIMRFKVAYSLLSSTD